MRKEDKVREQQCGRFREELELLSGPADAAMRRSGVLAELPAEVRGHAGECASCAQSLEDLVETRKLMVPLASALGEVRPGPWFSSQVMNAIDANENEMETREGVWVSVRKLAPRLAAVCALLLALVGTWAVQTQRAYMARQSTASSDSLFEPGPSAVLNDDVLASTEAHR